MGKSAKLHNVYPKPGDVNHLSVDERYTHNDCIGVNYANRFFFLYFVI